MTIIIMLLAIVGVPLYLVRSEGASVLSTEGCERARKTYMKTPPDA